MDILSVLKNELKEMGWVALYFFCCFVVVLTLKKLFLADYQVEINAVSVAAVSALITAKVVIVLDATHAGSRFDASFPLGLAAAYKTMVYILATFVILFLEKLIEAYWATGALGQAVSDVWAHRNRNILLAKVLCVGLAFLGYHLYAGLDRRLGKGALRRLVTGHPNHQHREPRNHS